MLPASLAACVPVFMATATSACASAGASLVPSPVIATSRPCAWCSRISCSLASGVASARKSSTPASAAMAAAVSGLSPVIMTVLMPMRRSSPKRSLDAALDDVLQLDDAEHPRAVAHHQRRAAAARDVLHARQHRLGKAVAERLDVPADGVRGALADLALADDRRRSCACAPRTARTWRRASARSRSRRLKRCLASTTMLRPSGVSSASEASCAASASSSSLTPAAGMKRRRLAVAERDRAGLVEQQHVDVARRLHRAAGSGDDVGLHHAAHAGHADRRQQAADGRRNEAHQQRDQRGDGDRGAELARPRRCRASTAAASRSRAGIPA